MEFVVSKENSCFLLMTSENCHIAMHFDIYEWTGFKFGMMMDTYLRSQRYKKAGTNTPVILKRFQLIWIEVCLLLKVFSQMNLVMVLSGLINAQGRELCWLDFCILCFDVDFHLNICGPIFVKHGMMDANILYNLMAFWIKSIFSHSDSYMRKQNVLHSFLICCITYGSM